ncbi:hypothetical protein HYD64_00885 [Mycoplasmopsis bovis]|nr:hypothetical protein [Mycoplasmopsis bovis]QQH60126.1 hypothetical protein HYD64_00885 [Mycoplasmopsis bovis]
MIVKQQYSDDCWDLNIDKTLNQDFSLTCNINSLFSTSYNELKLLEANEWTDLLITTSY